MPSIPLQANRLTRVVMKNIMQNNRNRFQYLLTVSSRWRKEKRMRTRTFHSIALPIARLSTAYSLLTTHIQMILNQDDCWVAEDSNPIDHCSRCMCCMCVLLERDRERGACWTFIRNKFITKINRQTQILSPSLFLSSLAWQ
jgi:hypothetical protein